MHVDSSTYNKAKAYQPDHGYELRKSAPASLIIHSTSNPNQKLTAFASEATFLLNSPLVSAHYLIGRPGNIAQFLDPLKHAAWHAGTVRKGWGNQKSIGIELHHSVGDPPYPRQQIDALSELVRALMAQFSIPVERIETHGQVAIKGPYDRKTDPSDMLYSSFQIWRATLIPPPNPARYRVVPIRISQKQTGGPPYAGELQVGEYVEIDVVYENNMCHLKNGAGFIPISALEGAG